MRTLNVGLSGIEIAARQGYLGGSDANILMAGDPAAILNLWKCKTGQSESEDLSGVLPVVMGSWTEELNRYWFERNTGRIITSEGDGKVHPEHKFMSCTLDGLTVTEAMQPAIFEAKHVNAFAKIDEVIQKYMPQIHHNMSVIGVQHAVLSVFIGTFTWECVEVARDDWYLAQLMDREAAFWQCVQTKEPPCELPSISAPAAPTKFRTVNMEGNNAWSASAADWKDNSAAAKKFEKATKDIKALMEADVSEASGHGIICKRSKDNKLSIKETK